MQPHPTESAQVTRILYKYLPHNIQFLIIQAYLLFKTPFLLNLSLLLLIELRRSYYQLSVV